MRVLLNDLQWQDRRSVTKCGECRTHDSSAFLCGWHENVVAATRIVRATLGTIEREQPDLLDGDR